MMTPASYPRRIPERIPDGMVLVHNHVRPRPGQGWNGFRFWLQKIDDSPLVVPCACGWAPEVGQHFRVARALLGAKRA
jgi:hypothetical protein